MFMKKNMKPRRLPRHKGPTLHGKSSVKPLWSLCASKVKPFTGKVFYLDLTSNRVAETLESDIKDLGGTVEKFFSKDIKYLVSNKKEAKYVQCLRQDSPVPSPESGPSSPQTLSHGDSSRSPVQKDAFAASRGKSLVKRVVKEQERAQMNKIFSNALEWGVKILYLGDVIAYVQKKKKEISSCQNPAPTVNKSNVTFTHEHMKANSSTKHDSQKCKGGRLSKPFVKVEDSSRHYRPFYLSLSNMPEFNLKTFPPCTPFCVEDKDFPRNRPRGLRGSRTSATDERANGRKKNKKRGGYCACCMVKYDSLPSHLQGERHKAFSKSNEYLVLDNLVSTMPCNFIHIKSDIKRPISSVLITPGTLWETQPRHKDDIDTIKIMKEELLFQHTAEGSVGGDSSGHASNICPISAPVVLRAGNRRKRRHTFSDASKHRLKQPCRQDFTSLNEADQAPVSQPKGEVAPSRGESVAAYPAFTSGGQLLLSGQSSFKDNEGLGAPQDMNVQSQPSSESHTVTKQESQSNWESGSRNLLQEKMTENGVLERDASCESFSPVRRIHRRIKVYKRKRRKINIPVVSQEHVESSDAAEDGMMKLWELFQASEDMDEEFQGFED